MRLSISPRIELLHSGDTFASAPTATPLIDYPGGGSLIEWTKTLDAVMNAWDFDEVIPGHGPMSNKAGMKAYRDRVEVLRSKAQGLVRSGKSQAELAKIMETEYKWAPESLFQTVVRAWHDDGVEVTRSLAGPAEFAIFATFGGLGVGVGLHTFLDPLHTATGGGGLSVPGSGESVVEVPMDEHAKSGLAPPMNAGVAPLRRLGCGGWLRLRCQRGNEDQAAQESLRGRTNVPMI